MRRGEDGEEPFKQFAADVVRVEAQAEVGHVANIAHASRTDWHASAWYLERKANSRWNRVDKHEVGGKDGAPLGVVILPPEKEPEPRELVYKGEPPPLPEAPDDDNGSPDTLDPEPGPSS